MEKLHEKEVTNWTAQATMICLLVLELLTNFRLNPSNSLLSQVEEHDICLDSRNRATDIRKLSAGRPPTETFETTNAHIVVRIFPTFLRIKEPREEITWLRKTGRD
jgi:hypothetical protein